MSKTQLVVIQPTSFCNINCKYCYLPYRYKQERMSIETLDQIFKVLFSSSLLSEQLTIVWHASEPLTVPVTFYEQAFALQKARNTRNITITNSFQTNGTLISQKWCDFFKAQHVQIGVSIDGPEHIHNANRVDRAGRGTFQRTMRGIELLRANDIEYSVIAVVTKDAVQYADEIWQFFTQLRPASLGFNPEETEGANKHASLSNDESVGLYKQFFARILQLYEQTSPRQKVREIEKLYGLMASGQTNIHAQTNTALAVVSFDIDGNMSTFSPELLTMRHPVYKDFIFGNVFTSTLEDIRLHPKFVELHTLIQRGVKACRDTCDYFLLCGGGAPSNKLYENGSFNSTETAACRMHVKAPTDAFLAFLEQKYYLAQS